MSDPPEPAREERRRSADYLPETPDLDGAYPRLSDEQIGALEPYGERRATSAGEVLIQAGRRSDSFYVLLAGQAVVVDPGDGAERVIRVHGPQRFLGELSVITGQVEFVTTRVRVPGEVLVVPADDLRSLVLRDPALGDLILGAYFARRGLLLDEGAGIRIIGSRFAEDTKRLRAFAARNRVPHRFIDLEEDPAADAVLRRFQVTPGEAPIVLVGAGRLLRNPSNRQLADALGFRPVAPQRGVADLVIVGAGPAGLAAAVYGASEGLNTVVVDAVATGGQAARTARIENYLGFPSGISGTELAERAAIQAAKFGARVVVPAEAVGLERDHDHYTVRTNGSADIQAGSVVIATGAWYRKPAIPNLERFELTSVYYAATHIEAQVCAPGPIAVIGGGNSAGQAALFLAKRRPLVYLVVRGDDLGEDMSRYLVDEILRYPSRIIVLTNTEVRELIGSTALEGIVVENLPSGRRETLDVHSLFVFIGAEPCTGWLVGAIALDRHGFVLTGAAAGGSQDGAGGQPLILETSQAGVFAVGDVRSGSIKRVASAVGEGAMAVRMVHERRQTPACAVNTNPADGARSLPSSR